MRSHYRSHSLNCVSSFDSQVEFAIKQLTKKQKKYILRLRSAKEHLPLKTAPVNYKVTNKEYFSDAVFQNYKLSQGQLN